jgi:CubicO group peptidase (beta-lactamase class C family)
MRLQFPTSTRTAFFVILSGIWFCTVSGQTTKPGREELARAVDEIFAEWNAPGSPGAAVILTDGGEMVLKRCYGLADIEHGALITSATRFELASVSKLFTAFSVLLLEQSGQLSLSDDIRKYFPELPDYGSPITIGNLIHHTSGITDYVRILPYTSRTASSGFGVDDLLRLVVKQRLLEFMPGTKWAYSNTNYALLAELVARVTHEPFGEWMHKNVFEPLGMHDSSFPVKGTAIVPRRANAYHRGAGGIFTRSLVENFEIPGPAHAFSTIDDMARWMENLRTGNVGGLPLITKMQKVATLATGQQTSYGAGLMTGAYRGLRTMGHSGQTGAFKTELVYCPEVEVGVVVLSNAGWMQADETARRVLDVYLADRLKPLPVATPARSGDAGAAAFHLDPAEYKHFLGGYRLDTDSSVLVAVSREGDWLVGVIVGEGLDFFYPVGPAEFENRHHNCRLGFKDDENPKGNVRSVRITLRGKEMRATRVEIPSDAVWAEESVGAYYSDELDAIWEIVRASSGLALRLAGPDSRPLQPADTDILVGGVGILRLLRDRNGHLIGLDFEEPEDFGARQIRFTICGRSF